MSTGAVEILSQVKEGLTKKVIFEEGLEEVKELIMGLYERIIPDRTAGTRFSMAWRPV